MAMMRVTRTTPPARPSPPVPSCTRAIVSVPSVPARLSPHAAIPRAARVLGWRRRAQVGGAAADDPAEEEEAGDGADDDACDGAAREGGRGGGGVGVGGSSEGDCCCCGGDGGGGGLAEAEGWGWRESWHVGHWAFWVAVVVGVRIGVGISKITLSVSLLGCAEGGLVEKELNPLREELWRKGK